MPETGDALRLLFQGLMWFGTAGGLALIYGFWDRKAKGKNDDRAFQSAEDKEWDAQQARFRAELIADRDDARRRARDLETECTACEREKDRVWDAARKMEAVAHDHRHRLADLLMILQRMLSPQQKGVLGTRLDAPPPVPSVHSLLAPQTGAA